MAEGSPTVASLQADIDAVRATYGDLRLQLEAALGRLYDDPASVADELLSQADEFGQEYAVALFAERPHDFGHVREHGDLPWAETAERAGEELVRLVDSHDRLDHLTIQREALLKRADPSRLPVVNIHGQEFVLDQPKRELRPLDQADERHPLNVQPVMQAEISLSEKVARSRAVEAVEPQLDHTPNRSRTR